LETAAGEARENVPMFKGNSVAVVVGASRYKIVTERAKILRVNIPKISNLLIVKKAKKGYTKKRYRSPTVRELEKQKEDTTYDVRYDLDGFSEKKIPRTRVIAF
jgi:hypothetical protein